MQVKFRGKRKGGNEWLIGDLSHIQGGVFIFPRENAPLNSPDWFEVEPSSIGMFTGLTDKNGKEIYGAVGERGGDIVKLEPLWFIEEDVERIEVAVWDKEMSRFTIGNKTNIHPNSNWEIIGNAFDNPELLEK